MGHIQVERERERKRWRLCSVSAITYDFFVLVHNDRATPSLVVVALEFRGLGRKYQIVHIIIPISAAITDNPLEKENGGKDIL